jgi:FkbH-like protein
VRTDINLSNQHASAFRFAISATFTADPLRPAIRFWARQLRSDFELRFAPYNQLLQTVLDPDSEFGQNTHGINVLLARLEDFGQFRPGDASTPGKIEANITHLTQELRSAGPRLPAPLLFCLCPSSKSFNVDEEFTLKMRTAIEAAFEDAAGVHYLDYCDIERLYPVSAVHNPEGERLGKIPYTDVYYCALGTSLVRYTHALMRSPLKVIALDCDNTLWDGICGEDGPEGVKLDPPRRALHEFMLEQREAGMLLTMASKNNEEDVLETFTVHPEMPLQLRHFAGWRLNWDPKAENIGQLADELGLGTDSFVFIDDNPKECAELQDALPEVATLPLPENIAETEHFLQHVWAFDHPVITEEDRNRSVYYQQQQEFGAEIRQATSLEEFMSSLDLRVNIAAVAPEKMPRAAQLTQRTNQFNLTAIRRTESDLRLAGAEGYECFAVDVSDRFGDYGLVGVLVVKPETDELRVDTFLLSCRALGRGVEHRMLAFLGQNAVERGLHSVVLKYVQTPKNSPARQFLDSIGPGEREGSGASFQIRVPAAQAAEITWSRSIPAAPERPARKLRKPSAPSHGADYAAIAKSLSTAEAILRQIRSERTSIGHPDGMTEVELKLARIWSELLERGPIARADNFFDLGGHSLLAVLLLLRIREIFGVELSIDDVYSGTLTLSDLAARIEAAQLGEIDPSEYAALLAEIEGMSDEEARDLLAREEAGQA